MARPWAARYEQHHGPHSRCMNRTQKILKKFPALVAPSSGVALRWPSGGSLMVRDRLAPLPTCDVSQRHYREPCVGIAT
jgi:hypothetical protein